MEGTLRIKVIHVDGTCMIAQGTDGLSIELMTECVMSVEYMMSCMPLHLISMKRSDNLLERIKYWWGQGNKVSLTPEDWFKKVKELLGSLPNQKGKINL